VAGWLRLSFWPCAAWMLAGKFLRYVVMTTVLLHAFPGDVPQFGG
jgi:membrane protein YqaA with SNARE-associated domain